MDESKARELLADIGLPEEGKMEKDRYIVKLENSDEWAKCYTLLSDYKDLEMSDVGSMAQEFATVLTYVNDDYRVSLNGNLQDDYYTVSVEEQKDE